MAQIAALERYATAQLAKLNVELPVLKWETTDDPVKMNAVFPQKEWEIDSPVEDLSEKRDYQHWYACDPSSATQLEIFFKRLEPQIAIAWVYVEVDGRRLVLREAMYNDSSGGHTYSAGGIRLECNAPMRRWRLALNAIMEDLDKPNDPTGVHVRLGAQVAVVGHAFELPKQTQGSFLARIFANNDDINKAKEEISKCCGECQAIMQPFTLFTELVLDGHRQELLLFGSRLKFFGNSRFLQDIRIHVAYAENGTTFTTFTAAEKIHGYCSNPQHCVQPINKGRWRVLPDSGEPPEGAAEERVSMLMQIEGVAHELQIGNPKATPVGALEAPEENFPSVWKCAGELSVRNKAHRMLCTVFTLREFDYLPEEKLQQLNLLRFKAEMSGHILLTTSEPECKNPRVSGGKGSSLAVLTELSKHFKSFEVPPGVVLTVNAYKMFAEQPEVTSCIDGLVRDLRGANMTQVQIASDSCVSGISKCSLPQSVSSQLFDKLREIFGNEWELKRFAVRSSAVGEDSEEMSAAGQMITLLGVRGKNEIESAIVQCWASQFSLSALNYKRQYGQESNSSMAVVVQEMVNPDSAGVMFTCDPVTSNPSDIFITANFGLGESVVSAMADPDTYSLRRDQGGVMLRAKTCGKKDRMVVESSSGNGTEEETIAPDKARTFCLTDELAVELASIGASLSDLTSTPRDFEWAILQGRIHLLQSRPVTSFLRESDYEIRHDLNTGCFTNREILSRANLDEIMPGVFSPLGISTFVHLGWETGSKTKFSEMFSGMIIDQSQYVYNLPVVFGKKGFMNYSKNPMGKSKSFIESTSVTMLGFDLAETDAMKNGIFHEHDSSIGWKQIKLMFQEIRGMAAKLEHAKKCGDAIKVESEGDSLTLFLSALRLIPGILEFLRPMVSTALATSMYNVITLNILKSSQGEKNSTPEMMILLSRLLRSDYEVESVEIPKELAALSNALRQDPIIDRFRQMTAEEALEWLENDGGEAAKRFRIFKSKNAHRCFKEFDIHAKTWDICPILLVRTLQSNVRSEENPTGNQEGLFMSIEQLPRRPSFMQRKLLNYFIRKAQYAVFMREATKSALVKHVHRLRLCMRQVGEQLLKEGRLTDPELVFFFTCDELYRFIKSRDPTLLPRAIRRQKMHPSLDQERFPSILYGMPKPIDSASVRIDPNAQNMQGTPVSEGVVVGPARVVKDFLTEAHLIEKGDILVTRATDTGWTPYFPLLSGVVTEIGGLLSHGAIVAREYGLPAVVGIPGVTEFVKSGDMVTLDGNNGLLIRNRPQMDVQDLSS